MNINRVHLCGKLTRDPEVKALPTGQSLVNFSIATNRVYKDRDGARKETTEFHDLVAFGWTAEMIAQFMRKGKLIYVEGRLQTRSWEKDGVKRYRTEVVVEDFQFGPSEKREVPPQPEGKERSDDTVEYPDEELNPADIPF